MNTTPVHWSVSAESRVLLFPEAQCW